MAKRKVNLIVFFIFILAFLTANFAYPEPWNSTADYLKGKIGLDIPHFFSKPYKLGLDLQGGIHLIYEADLSSIEKGSESSVMQGLRDIIERRINYYGIQEPVVQTEEGVGKNRLIVELAGVKDPQQAIDLIGQTPFLEFKEERAEEDRKLIEGKIKEVQAASGDAIEKIENWQLALQDPYFESTPLNGKYLKKSEIGFEQNTQQPMILLQFNDEGAKLFEEITERNVGKRLAIYIDGTLLSAPNVNEKISGGKAQITGNFTIKEAQDLVKNLNAGALPVPIKLISQQLIGPTLGAVSLRQSLAAGIYGFLAIMIFLIIYYRLPGIFASIALFVYVAVILSILKIINNTLTLAGIGGFILSLGMAVDANVLIFSRFREELKEGKSFGLAVEEGYKRSWPSVRDGNVTVIIVALILFLFGTSFVKGFALTLIIGNIVSVFSANFVTNYLMRLMVGTRLEKIKWLW